MLLVGVDIWVSSLPALCGGEWDGKTWCALSLSYCLSSLSGNRACFSSDISLNMRVETGFLSCCAVWADCQIDVGVSWCVVVGALRRVTGWWACLKTSVTLWALHIPYPGGKWPMGAQLAQSCPQTRVPALTSQPFAWMLGELGSKFRVVRATVSKT